MNIYVGSLPYEVRDSDLEELFSSYGEVISAKVILDRDTNRSKGFGFVEMPNAAALEAIEQLNEREYKGQILAVNESRPKERRSPGPRGADRGGRGSGRRDRY